MEPPPGFHEELTVTHDLTDQELKRFVNFDVYYDPSPIFGVLPQWVVLAALAGLAGGLCGAVIQPSYRGFVLGALIGPTSLLGILDLISAAHRRRARALGVCEGRMVSISPRGLSVRIPGAQPTSMIGVGPAVLQWPDIRRITVTDGDLMFWLRRTMPDLEGRARIVVPLRVFAGSLTAAADFETAARSWHAAATGQGAER